MKFSGLLTRFREQSGLTKSQLADRIGVSAEYIINVENEQVKKPPTIDRCHEIAKILNLSPLETQSLVDAAVEERLSPDELLWLTEREKKYEKLKALSQETLDALSDPDAMHALLSTFQSKEDIKPLVRDVIKNLNRLSKEQRKEIMKICK